jgi:hypothetical protein
MGEENELLKQISKPLPILSVFFTSILFLSIQQFLKKKKTCNWVQILSQNGSIMPKKGLRIKIKLKKKVLQSIINCERINIFLTCFSFC